VFDQRRARIQGKDQSWTIVYFCRLTYYGLFALVFVATTCAVAFHSLSGHLISICFIAAILAMSITSRAWRADEKRTVGFEFKDRDSEFMWNSLRDADFPILMPLHPGQDHAEKEREIRDRHQLDHDKEVVFLEICLDDPSDFYQKLMIEIVREENRYVIRVNNCTSVAHAIAAIALEMSRYSRPPGLHFGWPEQNMLSASWSYLAFGEGNIPWKVRELIQRMEKDPAKRPRVIVG
jgi:Co/Zn/Cd efflux system component